MNGFILSKDETGYFIDKITLRLRTNPDTSGGPQTLMNIRVSGNKMVGARGFEPPTPGPPDQCATRLRHAPN